MKIHNVKSSDVLLRLVGVMPHINVRSKLIRGAYDHPTVVYRLPDRTFSPPVPLSKEEEQN